VTRSPDGGRLLVADGRRLLLVDPESLDVVREVGRLPVPAQVGAWVTKSTSRADPLAREHEGAGS
jgi:hypothetical protein